MLSIVNMSDSPVNLRAITPIAALSGVTPQHPTPSSNTAAIQRLHLDQKARKILNDFNFDAIKLDAPTKLKLREMVGEFIDVFAECDSVVGCTNVVFH